MKSKNKPIFNTNGVSEFTASELRKWSNDTYSTNGWKPARPIGQTGFFYRLKKAWKVFVGDADIVTW